MERRIGFPSRLVAATAGDRVSENDQRIAWNPQRSLPLKDLEFTDAETARIRAALETWPAYGVAADRRWLEPLLRMIAPAEPASDLK